MFDEPVDGGGGGGDPGGDRSLPGACGICDDGTRFEVCDDDGQWVLVRCEDPWGADGDGYGEMLAGCPGCRFSSMGFLYLLFGDALGALPRELTASTAADRFGHSLVGVGDVNGDGHPDSLAGAPTDDVGGEQ